MNRVAITGMGAITPLGLNVKDFWKGLVAGVCGVGPIDRFDTAAFRAKLAAEVRGFDPEAFGISRGESRRMDLFAQYAMAAAGEAVEQSGVLGAVAPERLGVLVGSGIGGMQTFMTEHEKLLSRGPSRVSPLYIPMMIGNIAAGNIAIKYGAQGPCVPVVSACATSTNAIGEAYRTILHGYADAMIAGGAEATINPLAVAGFINCKALSESSDPNAASLPFDRRRGGFVMGEGAGVVVLENMDIAVRRGAQILGEIVGYESSCDAYHITAPDPAGAGGARAIAGALRQAGGYRGRLYVNAHGTGTPANDKTETLAIKRALGEEDARRAVISSIKSMTGHMLGAAGAVEAICSVLALREGVVPPTIHLLEKDPDCDLDYVPNTARAVEIDTAVSLSLGFGGHNGALAIRRFQ